MKHAAYSAEAAQTAADGVRERLGNRVPELAIILGSGLGSLATRIQDARSVPYADVPGFPRATVAGHAGLLIAGSLAERPVVALAGRFHLYEGHEVALAGFPVRVVHALGARMLFVSNAAGGLRRTFQPGDLMAIADHVNLMFRNPLIGATQKGDTRFPDMSEPYDRELLALLQESALSVGVPLSSGVYAGLLGPSYETPAEVRMMERLGIDAVGMSTVPEVIVARAIGMRVAGVSCITNLGCGITAEPLDHAEVLDTTKRVERDFERLVTEFVRRLPPA